MDERVSHMKLEVLVVLSAAVNPERKKKTEEKLRNYVLWPENELQSKFSHVF